MNPLATTSPLPDTLKMTPFSSPLPGSPQSPATTTNRTRRPRTPAIYPLLLLTSTAVAGAFCYLYLTKPVIDPPPWLPAVTNTLAPPPLANAVPSAASAPTAAPSIPLLPDAHHLPGDTTVTQPGRSVPAGPRHASPGGATGFEETNLRIQHVLTAETPGGDVSRIVLDVPVLYQTGTLAWTQNELAQSRELLKNLADYQEKSRLLRDEGSRLLAAWNHLVERSIPTPVLRADSPVLPVNQTAGEHDAPSPTFDTTESIQLQPAGK